MRKGQKHNEETRKKMRDAWVKNREHRIPWNKGIHTEYHGKGFKPGRDHIFFGKKRIFTDEHRKNMSIAFIGLKKRPISNETRQKIRQANLGDKSHFWKGGVTTSHQIIRESLDYRLWRKSVFERDNYTCVWCGDNHGNNLNADHIKSFSEYPELRFTLENGRTLCVSCHKKTDTYGWKSSNKTKHLR